MFSTDDFKRVSDDSGLTKAELAGVYGVSRQTIYSWLNGPGPRPDSIVARSASATTRMLSAMLTRKLLPLKVNADERKRRLGKITTNATTLRPDPVGE